MTSGPAQLDVALYAGDGIESDSIDTFHRLVEMSGAGRLALLHPEHVTPARLAPVDVLILPGGRGSEICAALGDAGKRAVRNYAAGGGSVLAICAGMYAVSARYPWSLQIAPIQVLDTKHWRRGEGHVAISLTPEGQTALGTRDASLQAYFYNGPVVAPYPDGSTPAYITLATFEDELVHPDGIRGLMVGSPAALLAPFGRGTVLAISPHLEDTTGHDHLVTHAIGYLAERRRRAAGAS